MKLQAWKLGKCETSWLFSKQQLHIDIHQITVNHSKQYETQGVKILFLFYPIFLTKSYFVLFFGQCPILSYFLAILPLILVFYSLFITIILCENIP